MGTEILALFNSIKGLKNLIRDWVKANYYNKTESDARYRKVADMIDADSVNGHTKQQMQQLWEQYATSAASTAKSEAIAEAALDATSKSATAKSEAIADAKTYTDAKIAITDGNVTNLTGRVTTAESNHTQLQGQVDSMNTNFTNGRNLQNDRLDALETDSAQAKTDISNLQSGKLDATATAANSSKLGGKTLAEVMADVEGASATSLSNLAADIKAAFDGGAKDFGTLKISDVTATTFQGLFEQAFGTTVSAWEEGKYHVRMIGANVTESATIGSDTLKDGDTIVLTVDATGAVTHTQVLVDAQRVQIVALTAEVTNLKLDIAELAVQVAALTIEGN